jgi:hypothetical protein
MMQRVERRPTIRNSQEWSPWRWPVDMPAVVQEHLSCAFDIKVVDISLVGCRIWAGFRLTPGRPARITMDGFAPFRGHVVWAEDWYAGLEFDRLIHTSVLTHLVARHPPRPIVVGCEDN